MKKLIYLVSFAISCLPALANDDDFIPIYGEAGHAVPVSVSGYSGEVDSVLKFDLFIGGCSVVGPNESPKYQLNGSNNGRVEGRLSQAGQEIMAKAFTGNSRIAAHALASEVMKKIHPETEPAFHGKIAFRVQQGSSTELAVADFDGYDPKIITHDGSLIATPSWIPNEFALLYSSWKNGSTQILKHDLSSGNRTVFARHPGSCFSPAVSPDGKKVAMVLDMSGSPNLWVSDIDGGNLKQLTFGRDDVSSPGWAPNSQELVFSTRSGRASLTKININGGSPKKLRVFGGDIYGNLTEPDWSPDGKAIIFTCGSGSFSICVVPSSGGEAKKLVDGEDPCWGPNSRTVIFTRRTNNKRVLSLLDVPTKHVKDCTHNTGSCSQPAWAR